MPKAPRVRRPHRGSARDAGLQVCAAHSTEQRRVWPSGRVACSSHGRPLAFRQCTVSRHKRRCTAIRIHAEHHHTPSGNTPPPTFTHLQAVHRQPPSRLLIAILQLSDAAVVHILFLFAQEVRRHGIQAAQCTHRHERRSMSAQDLSRQGVQAPQRACSHGRRSVQECCRHRALRLCGACAHTGVWVQRPLQ